ncbi:sigma-70 family RNA polymerase sigma factor [Chitinophaga rhizophila]|uniref:Sigma-70 family RNA polymerase sigma factor n=1 Tax=Chitinophaga rhizophila TaxID=2866212 RepID=A0ABS7G930_9BACT|nr:sigma-70 family RNA polymerase sigma factor [Chitinophaga rhizophila]MBW8683207.1 sigma-70 family RNA polymerase sigma factor [Chitinophaga rhizophila]
MPHERHDISADDATKAFRNRDADVFREIYTVYSEELYLLAYRWVKEQDLARDIVQGLFTYLWEKGPEIQITGNLRHYLYRAVTNRSINELKRRARHVSEEALQWQADTGTLHEITDHLLLQKEILRLSQELAPRCREIFLLSRFDGLEPSEIAARLDIAINTVYFQLAVALKHLRTHLLNGKRLE